MEEKIRYLINMYEGCIKNLSKQIEEKDYEDEEEEGQMLALQLCYRRVISDLQRAIGEKEWIYDNDTKVGLRVN